MNRKDRLRTNEEFYHQVLDNAEILYLALQDGDFPYCIPVNFARTEGRLYIHSAHKGLKLDCIRQNSHCAFSCAIDIEIDVDNATTYYKSVCGKAAASIVDDTKEKQLALDAITIRYSSHCRLPAQPQDAARVTIIKLDILEITGKCNCK